MINDDTKTLIMVASRIRPSQLKRMLGSFEVTKSPGTEICIYVADDDPMLETYRSILTGYDYLIGSRIYQADVFNLFSKKYPDMDYYGTVNDDHVYLTLGWDYRLINAIEDSGGWGLACAEDLLTNWKEFHHPGACIVSGNIVRTLGYYIYPRFRHINIDRAQGFLFDSIGKLFHLSDVIVEHCHWSNGKAEQDDNYRWIYGKEEMEYGEKVLNDYANGQMIVDIKKLKEAMK